MFFEELGVMGVYEAFEIGGGYAPDFWLCNLFWNKDVLVEIKPKTPNNEYIERLNKIRIPGKSDILLFVGHPSFDQPNGLRIFGDKENIIEKGFKLGICDRCGYYAIDDDDSGYILCACEHHPPEPDWMTAAEMATDFRFDL